MILLDTNVLIYAIDESALQHTSSRRAVNAAITRDIDAVVVPQVLVEFVSATTGPRMATPLLIAEAQQEVRNFQTQLRVLRPPDNAVNEFLDVLGETGRAGKLVYDYYLAAQARALGIGTICTYNTGDFRGISNLVVFTPESLSLPDMQG
jgi:predicted nucleic acid-binding protein